MRRILLHHQDLLPHSDREDLGDDNQSDNGEVILLTHLGLSYHDSPCQVVSLQLGFALRSEASWRI